MKSNCFWYKNQHYSWIVFEICLWLTIFELCVWDLLLNCVWDIFFGPREYMYSPSLRCYKNFYKLGIKTGTPNTIFELCLKSVSGSEINNCYSWIVFCFWSRNQQLLFLNLFLKFVSELCFVPDASKSHYYQKVRNDPSSNIYLIAKII